MNDALSKLVILFLQTDREVIELQKQRERAKETGNTARYDELSGEILDRLNQRAKIVAQDTKLQTNEQIKYSCTFVNTMAASIFTAGVATPVIGIFAPGSAYAANTLLLGVVSGGCFLTAMALHLVVRAMLGRLKA